MEHSGGIVQLVCKYLVLTESKTASPFYLAL